MWTMAKRRILHKLKVTEISGVDRPCQEGARMVLMKRAPERRVALEARLVKLRGQTAELEKFDPNQVRDAVGRWATSAGSAVASAAGVANRKLGEAARGAGRSATRGVKSTASAALERAKAALSRRRGAHLKKPVPGKGKETEKPEDDTPEGLLSETELEARVKTLVHPTSSRGGGSGGRGGNFDPRLSDEAVSTELQAQLKDGLLTRAQYDRAVGRLNLPEHRKKVLENQLKGGKVGKAWSAEAREAAIEARRRKRKGGKGKYFAAGAAVGAVTAIRHRKVIARTLRSAQVAGGVATTIRRHGGSWNTAWRGAKLTYRGAQGVQRLLRPFL